MTIRVYPSRLEGEPMEIHETDRVISVEQWIRAVAPSFSFDAESRHPTVYVNDNPINVDEWALTFFAPQDRVDIYIEARGPETWAAVIITAVLVYSMIPSTPAERPQSRNISDVGASANIARFGDPIPEIAGSPKVYPDHLLPPRRYYQGMTVQRVDQLLCIGLGQFQKSITQTYLGETPITSLGDDAVIEFFEPGEIIPPEYRAWWHSPKEVGFTSFGGAGLTLGPETPIASTWSESIVLSGASISSNTPVPESWRPGMVVKVQAAHSVTYAFDWIESAVLEAIEIEVGETIEVDGAIAGQYVVDSISNAGAVRYHLAGADFDPGSEIISTGRVGMRYQIVSMENFSIEVVPDGLPLWSGFPSAVSNANSNISVPSDAVSGGWIGPFVATPEGELSDAFEVDIFYPQGLIHYTSKGYQRSTTQSGVIAWRFVGETEWNYRQFSNTQSTADQIGFTYRTLHANGRVEVMVRADSAPPDSTQTTGTQQWSGLRSRIVGAPESYPGMTTMFVSVRSGDKVSASSEDQITVRPTRILPTVADPSVSAPTRDIMPFFYHIMSSVGYGRELLDLPQLEALHGILSARGDTFDLEIKTASTLKKVANYCLGAGFSELTVRRGKISAVRDSHRTGLPSRIYSPHDFTEPLVETTEMISPDDIDGVDVEYIDYASGRTMTAEYRLPDDLGQRVETIKVPGVTNRTQAWRIAARHRRTIAYRRTAFKGSTELAAMNSNYMDYVGLQDSIPSWGQSAFVIAQNGSVLTLSEPIEPIDGTAIAMLRRRDGTAVGPVSVLGISGHDVTLAPMPHGFEVSREPGLETVVYLGTVDTVIHKALIKSIRPGADGRVEFEAVIMDNRIYSEDGDSPYTLTEHITSWPYPVLARESSAASADIISARASEIPSTLGNENTRASSELVGLGIRDTINRYTMEPEFTGASAELTGLHVRDTINIYTMEPEFTGASAEVSGLNVRRVRVPYAADEERVGASAGIVGITIVEGS